MSDGIKKSLRVACPICGEVTDTKIFEDTVLIHFPLYCCHCEKETQIDVVQMKMAISE